MVDAGLRSSDPDMYAAGDVACAYHPGLGRHIRVEHWANALNQPQAAARAMLGQEVAYDRVPYFFTDQYDLGMEYAGYVEPGGYDQVVFRGDVAGREFVTFWLADGRVQAGMNVNVWDVNAAIQDLVRSGRTVDADQLADPGVPLEAFLDNGPWKLYSMPTRIIILGAGFGGLELATRLSSELAGAVEVTLIDRNEEFIFGFSKLDVMFGRRTMDEVRLPYRSIAKPSVEFRQETILSIDPERKRVVTNAGTHEADILVIALGADLARARPRAWSTRPRVLLPGGGRRRPGHHRRFPGRGHRDPGPWRILQAPACALRDGVLAPRRPDPARATGRHDHHARHPDAEADRIYDASRRRSLRLDERGIHSSHATWTRAARSGTKVAHLRDGRALPFDLFLAVPEQVATPVVVELGPTEDDGCIAVDKATLATKWPDVYAVGDVASVPVPRVALSPRVRSHRGRRPPPARRRTCPRPLRRRDHVLRQMGGDTIGRVNVNFLAGLVA